MTRNGGHWVVPRQETRGRWGSLTGVTDPFLHSSGEKPEPSSWQHNISAHSGPARERFGANSWGMMIVPAVGFHRGDDCKQRIRRGKSAQSQTLCACKLLDKDSTGSLCGEMSIFLPFVLEKTQLWLKLHEVMKVLKISDSVDSPNT